MQNSPAPVDTSKIQLHVEQFTLKLTGDWQEDCHTTKAVQKIHAAESGGKRRGTENERRLRRRNRKRGLESTVKKGLRVSGGG